MDDTIRCVKASGLRVTAFQPLRDFEGLDGALHAYKVDVAKALIEMCAALRAPVLVTTSSVLSHASTDPGVIAADLRKLAMLALPFDVKVAYAAVSWGRAVTDFRTALDVVGRADMPNLGLGIDSFHALAAKMHLDDLEMVSPTQSSWCNSPTSWWRSLERGGFRPRATCVSFG